MLIQLAQCNVSDVEKAGKKIKETNARTVIKCQKVFHVNLLCLCYRFYSYMDPSEERFYLNCGDSLTNSKSRKVWPQSVICNQWACALCSSNHEQKLLLCDSCA